MKNKRCKDYVGVACVDGSCPIANRDEYLERCMDVISNCDDCALCGTKYCTKSEVTA